MKELEEGSVIGNYRIVRQLGRGGMGTVYEVEHIELGTHYALKTYTFDSGDETSDALKKKFLEEGKLLARLKHPNLTHVFDLGFEEKTQMPYFVMDLVTYEDGGTYTVEDVSLADIDEEMVYSWFVQLASALDYIHGEGIVHRDIKPSNLLVDKDLNIVLTDFGISRIFGSKIKSEVDASNTMVTKTGRGKLVLGTRHYIAPEVAEGEEATPKADAYALGVMLLRWLTGFYYGDNPGAITLLSRKKYRWLPAISRLLAPADRRPDNYTELLALIQPPEPASTPTPESSPAESAPRADGNARKKAKAKDIAVFTTAALLIALAVGGAIVGGKHVWRLYEADKRRQQEQVEALKRQMEAKAAADRAAREAEKAERERLAAEQAKQAEAKRLAEEAARKKEAEVKRIAEETARKDAEAKRLAEERAKQSKTAKPEPPKEKPKDDFTVVSDDDVDTKDYGPVPNRTYKWLKGGDAANPQPVAFELANGAKMDLVPMKAGVFFMTNNGNGDKAYHKVTITRPFWVSKYRVTTAQWRDFDEQEVAECVEIEKLLKGSFPLSKDRPRERIERFCEYLSKRYRSQLPKGYVFRLPTEAEWGYAVDVEGLVQKYGASFYESVGYMGDLAKANMKKLFANPELKNLFELIGNNNYNARIKDRKSHSLLISGLANPNGNGIHDLLWVACLDRVSPGAKLEYSDEETDPLSWTTANVDVCYLLHDQPNVRLSVKENGVNTTYHIVVGPDLVKERAWETCRVKRDVAPPRVPVQSRFNPSQIPDRITTPKIVKLRMACGAEMEFCAIPKGKFNMSNPDGQDKTTHKVTLTRPYWMSRYCVTANQWRDFAKHDCEGDCRKAEKAFPKNPICPAFRKYQWRAFCRHLNDNYSSLLPKGYVFRLPTEAEWEWAFAANENIRNCDRKRFDPFNDKNKDAFRKLKKRVKDIHFNDAGTTHYGTQLEIYDPYSFQNWFFVGGRLYPNVFGLFDMNCPRGVLVFDEYVAFGHSSSYESLEPIDWPSRYNPKEYALYEDEEIDPVHWEGLMSTCCLTREFERRDFLNYGYKGGSLAHIVIAPDLGVEERVRNEEASLYPPFAFGGELLWDRIRVTDISSRFHDEKSGFNTPERWALVVSGEPVIVPEMKDRKDLRGCYTDKEKSPWVELSFDSATLVTGIQVDVFRDPRLAEHLRIWTSEDGKNWREVAKDDVIRRRYKFDLRGKNVKAKYIRVGREPRFRKIGFAVNKILVYGKK